jgi:hypothetical protein
VTGKTPILTTPASACTVRLPGGTAHGRGFGAKIGGTRALEVDR